MNSEKILSIAFLLFLSVNFSCSDDDDEMSRAQEAQILQEMFAEIDSLASSEDCEDASVWAFTPYGSKACGGPIGYIAYSTNIDTTSFLNQVEEHRIAQQEYNEKWEIISDCSVPTEPEDVICENREAVLVY